MRLDFGLNTVTAEERLHQSYHFYEQWEPPCGGRTYQLHFWFIRVYVNLGQRTNGKYRLQFNIDVQL